MTLSDEARTLTDVGIQAAAESLACEPAIVRAVAEVEAQGDGFLDDGRPKILFEARWFSRLTGGKFDVSHPTISCRTWEEARKHYKGGAREWQRLFTASVLDEIAALESASWGAFQIMGFNAQACGFPSVRDFCAAMHESADRHLAAFVAFVKSKGLADRLQRKAWADFAAGYNGPKFAENKYHLKLAAAYARHSKEA